jgi:hypothetical protein
MDALRRQRMSLETIPSRAADSAAASSAFLAGAAWVAEVEPYITALAGLVAIMAGAAAAWYHIERIRVLRQNRKRGK